MVIPYSEVPLTLFMGFGRSRLSAMTSIFCSLRELAICCMDDSAYLRIKFQASTVDKI